MVLSAPPGMTSGGAQREAIALRALARSFDLLAASFCFEERVSTPFLGIPSLCATSDASIRRKKTTRISVRMG